MFVDGVVLMCQTYDYLVLLFIDVIIVLTLCLLML